MYLNVDHRIRDNNGSFDESPSKDQGNGWDWSVIASGIIGASMHLSFTAGGQVFWCELLLLSLLPILIFDRFYLHRDKCSKQTWLWKPMTWILLGLLTTSVGYVLSDLYRNNIPADYLRGWARLFFLGIDLFAVGMLISIRVSNFWALAFGYSVLGCLALIIQGVPLSNWKFGYSVPITLGAITIMCAFSSCKVHMRGTMLIALGLLNMFMDYRSLGAFCVVVAIIGWIQYSAQRGSARLIQTLVLAFVVSLLMALAYYASQGDFSQRRQTSNSMRLSSALVGVNAVLESPLLGYGSWGKDARFAKQLTDIQFRMTKTQENPLYDFDLIKMATFPAHSQILESWIEGGILGVTFFIVYFVFLVQGLNVLIFKKHDSEMLSQLLTFFIIWGMWALFLSPFKGLTRMDITFAIFSVIIARRFYLRENRAVSCAA